LLGSLLQEQFLLALLRPPEVYTNLSAPGSTSTVANGINNSGQIVGTFIAGGFTDGFTYSGGSYTTNAFPGTSTTGSLELIVGAKSSERTLSLAVLIMASSLTTLSTTPSISRGLPALMQLELTPQAKLLEDTATQVAPILAFSITAAPLPA
jgi:hypothetical protein